MKIEYRPWDDSHAPQKFHRTDPTGRWSPIRNRIEDRCPPNWMSLFIVAGWLAIAVVLISLCIAEIA